MKMNTPPALCAEGDRLESNPVTLLGASGVGKTFVINCLLQVFDKGVYGYRKELNYADEKAIQRKDLKDIAPGENVLYVLPNKEGDYPSQVELDYEAELMRMMPNAATDPVAWNRFVTARGAIPGFLLTSGDHRGVRATTGHTTTVAFADDYRFVVEYRRLKDLENELRSYPFLRMLGLEKTLKGEALEYHRYMVDCLQAVCDIEAECVDTEAYYGPEMEDELGFPIELELRPSLKTRYYPREGKDLTWRENVLKCAGKTLFFVGEGKDATRDRLYMRRTMFAFLRDGISSVFKAPCGTMPFDPAQVYSSESRTSDSVYSHAYDKYLIKEVNAYAPCAILEHGVVIRDCPGVDADEMRGHALREALSNAKSLVVLRDRASDANVEHLLREFVRPRVCDNPRVLKTNAIFQCNEKISVVGVDELAMDFDRRANMEIPTIGPANKVLFSSPDTTSAIIHPFCYFSLLMNPDALFDHRKEKATKALHASNGLKLLDCIAKNLPPLRAPFDFRELKGICWKFPDLTKFIEGVNLLAKECSDVQKTTKIERSLVQGKRVKETVENEGIDVAMLRLFYRLKNVRVRLFGLLSLVDFKGVFMYNGTWDHREQFELYVHDCLYRMFEECITCVAADTLQVAFAGNDCGEREKCARIIEDAFQVFIEAVKLDFCTGFEKTITMITSETVPMQTESLMDGKRLEQWIRVKYIMQSMPPVRPVDCIDYHSIRVLVQNLRNDTTNGNVNVQKGGPIGLGCLKIYNVLHEEDACSLVLSEDDECVRRVLSGLAALQGKVIKQCKSPVESFDEDCGGVNCMWVHGSKCDVN